VTHNNRKMCTTYSPQYYYSPIGAVQTHQTATKLHAAVTPRSGSGGVSFRRHGRVRRHPSVTLLELT